MDPQRFDALARALGTVLPRRFLVGAAAGALGLAVPGSPRPAQAKKRNKPKKNAFGCLNVGKKCNGKDRKCCSGICKGKRPRKGKKDKSTCVAHNVGGCQAGQDSNRGEQVPCGVVGICLRTTGKASFCGVSGLECGDCRKDSECVGRLGPGAACVDSPGCTTDPATMCRGADPTT
jgi:hypothetical protein